MRVARGGRSRHGTPAMSRSEPAGDTASNGFIISRCARTRSSRSVGTTAGPPAPNISAIASAVARASSRIPSYSSGHSVMRATLSRSGVRFSRRAPRDSGDQHAGATDEVPVDARVGEPGVARELERTLGLVRCELEHERAAGGVEPGRRVGDQ